VTEVLLDPSRREEDWLLHLRREAEAVYGADRASALDAALQRLSRALAHVAAAGAALDLRTPPAAPASRPRDARDA
jgi:hypothetical protein